MNKFYYLYVLISLRDKKLYIGTTDNLRKRILRHNKGFVKSTKTRLPLELIFYEAYRNKFDALRREDYLKTTGGKRVVKQLLREFFINDNEPS